MNTGDTDILHRPDAKNTKVHHVAFKFKKINEKVLKEAGGEGDK